MQLQLPDDVQQLAAVIRGEALDGIEWSPARWLEFLQGFGAFAVLADGDRGDGESELYVNAILREVAYCGCRAPVAETMWASKIDRSVEGWVSWPSSDRAPDGAAFAPYGSLASHVVIAEGDAAQVRPVGELTLRHGATALPSGHAWVVDAPAGAQSFATHAPGFVWRSAAALTAGYAARALAMAARHAADRVQFGKPLASFQAVQFRLAESRWRLAGLELLVREAAWRASRDDSRAEPVSALAWLYARRIGHLVDRHAHQVFGAIGFSDEMGLTALSAGIDLLRLTVPAADAATLVVTSRVTDPDPSSTVLGGFRR